MSKKEKRPPFWRLFKRAYYDAMNTTYEFVARVLRPEEAEEFGPELPSD
jgi:hypothetical protein